MSAGFWLLCALVALGLYVAVEVAVDEWRATRPERPPFCPVRFEQERRADPERTVALRVLRRVLTPGEPVQGSLVLDQWHEERR